MVENHIINNIELFDRLVNYFTKSKSNVVTFDVETDSVEEKFAKIYGLGLTNSDKKGFYVVWRSPEGSIIWTEEEQKRIINWFFELTKTRYMVGHNAIYDILVIENNWGIDITDCLYSDTILQRHLINEEGPFGLKDIAVLEFGEDFIIPQEKLKINVIDKGGKWKKDQKDMYLADSEVLGEYCIMDCILTYKLFLKYEEQIKADGMHDFFYKDETIPLYKLFVIPAKRRGFPIDVEHFNKIKAEITVEIDRLEQEVMGEIEPEVGEFVQKLLDKDYPVMSTGNFPKALAEVFNIPLPINSKTDKITLAKKAILEQMEATPKHKDFYTWVIEGGTCPYPLMKIRETQEKMFFKDNPEQKYVFNLGSSDHLRHYFFDIKKFKPLAFTEKEREPKANDDFFDSIKSSDDTVNKLIEFKKLEKIKSTYVEGILSRQVDGKIYSDLLAYGTTSGRFSSRSPNLQNLPRKKEDEEDISPLVLKYTNAIRKGFIAGKGCKLVDSDYNQLEVMCFGHMSGSPQLIKALQAGEDLYSRVAIDTFGLKGVSANKKDPNYLKNIDPEKRQISKVFCLAVVYGAEASRISGVLGVSYKEANQIISAYLRAYPDLKKYMRQCEYDIKAKGQVKTSFGRIRHLPEAELLHTLYGDILLDYKWAARQGLEKERRRYKNILNLAKNHPIQGLAAHIINRALIATIRKFREKGLEAYPALMIHDQVITIAKEEEVEQVRDIMRDCMQNTIKLSTPLIAEPEIGENMLESH